MEKVFLFLLIFFLSTASQAIDRFYMSVFSHQDGKNTPHNAHTFASFVKITSENIETQTISWGPYSGIVEVLGPPVYGRNQTLLDTLHGAFQRGLRVSEWGPYEIHEELYQRAKIKVAELNSGRIYYKVIDKKFRPWQATNCFHAIADLDMSSGLLHFGTMRGDAASERVFLHLSRWIVSNQKVNTIEAYLGIDQLPLLRR